jgi:hypothetical protein
VVGYGSRKTVFRDGTGFANGLDTGIQGRKIQARTCSKHVRRSDMEDKVKLFPRICLVFALGLLPAWAEGGTYYVSNGAKGSWAGATNRLVPCSYSTANSNAVAGDTVVFIDDGGTFNVSDSIIAPTNSGSSGHPITFKGEDGTTVILRSTNDVVDLVAKSYITIENLTIKAAGAHPWVNLLNYNNNINVSAGDSSYITIQNCNFIWDTSTPVYSGIRHTGNLSYFSVLNCTFDATYAGGAPPLRESIYCRPWSGYSLHHVRIEGNTFNGGAHMPMSFVASTTGLVEYVIIKNNNIRNPYHTGLSVFTDRNTNVPDHILVEGNVIYDCGSACSLASCPQNTYGSSEDKGRSRYEHNGLQWAASESIIRRNLLYNNGSGLKITSNPAEDNRIYHNVFYGNVVGTFLNASDIVDSNYWVNNVYIDNELAGDFNQGDGDFPVYVTLSGSPCDNRWRYNNFDGDATIRWKNACNGSLGDRAVAFMDGNRQDHWWGNLEKSSGFTNKQEHDFTLGESSELIDAGDWLTRTKGSGKNSTTLVVDDARYFMDGWGMISGDLIQLEGQTTPVMIRNVNYSTNTITTDRSLSWSDGQGVSLAYSGGAPDIGAHEFVRKAAVRSPGSLSVKAVSY